MIMRVDFDSTSPHIKVARLIDATSIKTIKTSKSQEALKQSVDKTFHDIYSLNRGQSG